MLRRSLALAFAVLALALPAAGRAAVAVFQDPGNTGATGAPPAQVTVGGPSVSLHLFYQGGSTASASNACLSGNGEEVCGWDVHVSTSGPGVVLQSFTPDTGPGSDVVAAISGNVLRANGGVPTTGELGIHRIGTLVVSASAPGSVTVSGNLYVTASLQAAAVTTGNTLAIAAAGGPDTDGDGVEDASDNCVNVPNPPVAEGFLAANAWATLTGGQRDDDHDGYGNRCDGDFTATGALIGTNDLTQYRASSGKSRLGDTCGTAGNQPCARYDLDESGALINTNDLTVYRGLSGKAAGPKCAACPLTCTAGTAGSCSFPF